MHTTRGEKKCVRGPELFLVARCVCVCVCIYVQTHMPFLLQTYIYTLCIAISRRHLRKKQKNPNNPTLSFTKDSMFLNKAKKPTTAQNKS